MSPILGQRRQLLVALACVLALVSAMGLTPESSFPARITVKLVDGLEIRLSERRVSGVLAPKQESAPPIQKKGLTAKAVEQAFSTLNVLLQDPAVLSIEPLFSDEAGGLRSGTQGSHKRDLGLYITIALKHAGTNDADRIIAKLLALPIVETAYQAPIPEDAGAELPTN